MNRIILKMNLEKDVKGTYMVNNDSPHIFSPRPRIYCCIQWLKTCALKLIINIKVYGITYTEETFLSSNSNQIAQHAQGLEPWRMHSQDFLSLVRHAMRKKIFAQSAMA